jgi:hypothetical protein
LNDESTHEKVEQFVSRKNIAFSCTGKTVEKALTTPTFGMTRKVKHDFFACDRVNENLCMFGRKFVLHV